MRFFFTYLLFQITLISFSQTPRLIRPSTTDPNITTIDSAHYIYIPEGTAQNLLFVFLPGTGAAPENYQLISEEAANLGLHVVNLSYQNDISPNGPFQCFFSSDITCHGRFRAEIFDGIDRSNLVNVTPANSTQNRLLKILQYLDQNFPTEGWGQYLSNGEIVWSKIKLGGHSQGGNHAGYIGKIVELERSLMFASNDWLPVLGRTAAWMSADGLTPPTRYFSFAHRRDEIFPYGLMVNSWSDLGMNIFGNPVEVENSSSPYEQTRTLNSDISVPGRNHSAIISDEPTPFTNGDPTYAPVWRYMLNKPVENVRVATKANLEGAYESDLDLMRDDLRMKNLIPIQEPFSALGLGGNGETIENGVLNVSGDDAIVDWVLLEIKDELGNIATRAALLQRDGDIVDVDGQSAVLFSGILEEFYRLSIRTRNHLRIDSAEPILLRAE
ncbi:MAG: hypothetical protein AAF806_01490 [Bacteroidota bacterium]